MNGGGIGMREERVRNGESSEVRCTGVKCDFLNTRIKNVRRQPCKN